MLSTVTWIPRGFACANPAAYDEQDNAMDGPEAAALALSQQREARKAEAEAAAAVTAATGGGAAGSDDEDMDSALSTNHSRGEPLGCDLPSTAVSRLTCALLLTPRLSVARSCSR